MNEDCISVSFLEKQVKSCGHDCFPSSTLNCCACMDLRPVLDGDCYPVYVDGEGWQENAPRNIHYCPVCNPQNFDEWIKRLRIQREEKAAAEAQSQQEQALAQDVAEKDRQRASKVTSFNDE